MVLFMMSVVVFRVFPCKGTNFLRNAKAMPEFIEVEGKYLQQKRMCPCPLHAPAAN